MSGGTSGNGPSNTDWASSPEAYIGPQQSQSPLVESPSVGTSNALARFEYESGRTKDCTKVLMVEWEDDEKTRNIPGEWTVSWEQKKTVLSSRDTTEGCINRLYFLLSAVEKIPGIVHLTLTPTSGPGSGQQPIVWKANPLPAIFPPELGASAREAGKKGVLHTIWAKRRLQVLAQEIDRESRQNAEGVALTMATQESEWIEQNFGVHARPVATTSNHREALAGIGNPLNSPQSPRSPGGSRLMDKLKGLKLNTGEKELRPADETTDFSDNLNPLSPEQSDVAVSSFGSFAALKGIPDSSILAAKSPQPPTQSRRIAPQRPPDAILAQQRQAGNSSLSALASGQTDAPPNPSREDDKEDDLFALPISPRSPDMSKSPFSFASTDTAKYREEGRV